MDILNEYKDETNVVQTTEENRVVWVIHNGVVVFEGNDAWRYREASEKYNEVIKRVRPPTDWTKVKLNPSD